MPLFFVGAKHFLGNNKNINHLLKCFAPTGAFDYIFCRMRELDSINVLFNQEQFLCFSLTAANRYLEEKLT